VGSSVGGVKGAKFGNVVGVDGSAPMWMYGVVGGESKVMLSVDGRCAVGVDGHKSDVGVRGAGVTGTAK
jgi:hypothetical protein